MESAINDSSSISDKAGALKRYSEAVAGKSNYDARAVAKDILGASVSWNWDCASCFATSRPLLSNMVVPRTREGYYHYTGGIEVSFVAALFLLAEMFG